MKVNDIGEVVNPSGQKRNLLLIVVFLVVIIVISIISSSGSVDPLSLEDDGIKVIFADDNEFVVYYEDIISVEYLDYIPEEVSVNAPHRSGIYQGTSIYNGTSCWCYLEDSVSAAGVVRTEEIIFLFNMESPNTTKAVCDELMRLSGLSEE